MQYLFESFVIDEAGTELGNFELALLNLLAEFPAQSKSSAKMTSNEGDDLHDAAVGPRMAAKFGELLLKMTTNETGPDVPGADGGICRAPRLRQRQVLFSWW
ncbi:hypothetical protein G6O67_000149 [Ophiocordyceps sinensis]|uniref:Uncharacterized protein n=1 Tax=Ophiocordyceps sinensis TaxID=72228 RepID=A0A8H4V9N0_9HYPO|nr:hypothetical protein G6O67_000149 [Ophiocordyceps sinensis]